VLDLRHSGQILQSEANTAYRNYSESVDVSLTDAPGSQSNLAGSPSRSPVIAAGVSKLQLPPVYIKWENLCLYVGNINRIVLSSDNFCSHDTLVLGLICLEFLIFPMFFLNSRI
jgi:hypothetical protein